MYKKLNMRNIVVIVISILMLASCAKRKHKIGDMYKGGYIFYINRWGKGMCAAPKEASKGSLWGCYGNLIDGANGFERGTGKENTKDILSGCDETKSAAYVCDNYATEDYDDWYLPSIEELELMYNELHVQGFGEFYGGRYWSSTQDFSLGAWYFNFSTGERGNDRTKNDEGLKVRAVRSF
jgi:hypothetical protein